jgi:hypothetical protein
MSVNAGVWIDHKRAVIVVPGGDAVTTVVSSLRADVRHKGGGGYPGSDSAQGGGSERRAEAHHQENLARYYDDVIARLGHPTSLLIFGPGEAKLELKARLPHSMPNPQPAVAVETADHLTDPQIAAAVRAHFA